MFKPLLKRLHVHRAFITLAKRPKSQVLKIKSKVDGQDCVGE
jgi:hypothetical protein